MASPSTSTNVRALAEFYECRSLSTSRNVAGGIREHDQQLIANELGNRVNEAQRRDKASGNSPPPIPPRPNRPVMKKADTEAVSCVEENGEKIGDGQYTLSEEEKLGPRQVDTTQGPDPQELEQQAQQAHQKTQELTVQHTGCKSEIKELNNQIENLQEEIIDLKAAGSASKAFRAELRRRIEDLEEKLAQANTLEEALREELRESRQRERDFENQLAEANLQVIQQRRDSAAREFELEQRWRQAERAHEEAAARGRQVLDSESREQQSPGDSNSEAPRIQPVMTRPSLRAVALMQEQQRQNDRLERQNRALARAGSAARTEVENARRELARLQKEKEKKHKVQKRGLYRNRNGVMQVFPIPSPFKGDMYLTCSAEVY
ncbi:hypothetical protein BR93DRAFT_967687 [Coniochaeta sp. PMI_546]|nr:hypothetical protein BR93DRAFT_967687 [Coniochaeta sp. PMI_546]